MKKLLYGTFLLVSWLILNLTTGWSQQAIGPRMVLEKNYFDAKQINEGEIIEHTFTVLNRGDQPLKIKKINPGWGCAVAHFDRTIPPGGEGKITVKVNTRGLQGKIRKRAKVYTNDPRKKVEVLSIKAYVKALIYLSPRYVSFRGLAGQKITKTVRVKAKVDKPLKLEQGYFDLGKKVTYRIEEVEAGRIFRIHFTTIPGIAGNYRGVLKLKTNYPEKPEIVIPIRAKFQKGGQG